MIENLNPKKTAVASPKIAILQEERSSSRPKTAQPQKLRLRMVSSASPSRRVYFSDSDKLQELGTTDTSKKLEPKKYIRPSTAPFDRSSLQRSISRHDESLPDSEFIKSYIKDYCLRYNGNLQNKIYRENS
jgi:hypothetical protein